MVRYTIYYSGRVQGVGFRYTAVQAAEDVAVAGYVANLPDGRVLLVAEGEKAELDTLMENIRKRMGRYIRQVERDEMPANEEFGPPTSGGLQVRY